MSDERRLNYFKGQFLREEDFKDEQNYHISRLERHTRLLHTSGIAEGLEVRRDGNSSQFTVTQGTAIDGNGKMIVSDSDRSVPVDPNLRGEAFIVISYADQEDDKTKVEGKTATRRKEVPNLGILANPSEDTFVRLARIRISQDGAIDGPDLSIRRRAGQPTLGDGTITESKLDTTLRTKLVNDNAISEIRLDPALRAKLVGNVRIPHSSLTLDGGRNPHQTTAADVAALPLTGGTLSGRLRVNANVAGTVSATGGNFPNLGSIFVHNSASSGYGIITKLADTADVAIGSAPTPAAALVAASGYANVHGIYTVARPGTPALLVDGDIQLNGSLNLTGNAFKPNGGSWSTPSDRRLKHHIQPLYSVLDRLLKLQGVSFEWNEPAKHGNLTGPQIGMIAQEVETVFPEWIDTGSDGYKILTFRGFEALTVEAFRELKAENDHLKALCRSLEARLTALETQSYGITAAMS